MTFSDPAAYAKPWGFTASRALVADTDMLESVCERSSDHWSSRLDAAAGVHVAPDVLARYVGVYSGIYGGRPRTVEVSLSNGELFVTNRVDEPVRLVPRTQTLFESESGYEFVVDDKGVATHVVEIHDSGRYRYARQP